MFIPAGGHLSLRRPCESRDPYAAAGRFNAVADSLHNNKSLWLWVPAFAGTTSQSNVDTPIIVGKKAPVTIIPPNRTNSKPDAWGRRQWLPVIALIAAMTAMRLIYAGVLELRTDEAYYWTWSKESVLSFLDHPPMIAWFIRFGTAIFGDSNLGVRFAGRRWAVTGWG